MSIQKINKESISDQVFRQMKEQVIKGEWKPGEKIPSENELARLMGVSRVTVRNALQRLSALGLVETRFGEGSFVCRTDADAMLQPLIPAAYLGDKGLEEVLLLRRMLEGPVCEAACSSASREDIQKLCSLLGEMEQYRNDLKQFASADYRFHLELARMTGNTLLIKIYSIINDVMENAFEKIVLARGSQSGLYYHSRLVEAFERGDGSAARAVMEEHMQDLYESFRKAFRE